VQVPGVVAEPVLSSISPADQRRPGATVPAPGDNAGRAPLIVGEQDLHVRPVRGKSHLVHYVAGRKPIKDRSGRHAVDDNTFASIDGLGSQAE
jgi:hypothetical protein